MAVENRSADLSGLAGRTVVRIQPAEAGEVDLTVADVIVAGGRGVGGQDKFAVIFELAKADKIRTPGDNYSHYIAIPGVIQFVKGTTAVQGGLWTGMIVGGLLGWWVAPSLGVSPAKRGLCALGAGAYCTLPVTSFLPLATLFGFLVKLRATGKPEPAPGAVIEAEYEVVDDESGS